ncbi:Peroxinectin [Kaumoebavirus]|uniref:Peroxinectin n=1 Tax=Kaumoebavirus TaxID=1859492 RepID=UPI0009C3705E|nr:Peroxinectin [Kaumoebavirus]ARA71987.1 Peroxinectin [Kaumoebavirus]
MGMNARNETMDAVFSTPDNDTDAIIIPIIEEDDPLPPTVFVASRKFRIRTLRSLGAIVNGQFEIYSDATPFLDLGPLYGLNQRHADALRTFSGGRLITKDYVDVNSVNFGINATATIYDWMPTVFDTKINTSRVVDLNQPDQKCFSTGDPRANENIGLLVIHSIFLREHNRRAAELAAEHPEWNDEQLYQRARDWTIAIYQHIVFDEYLPSVLGPYVNRLRPYERYDPEVDPRMSVVFASAAFRFGHSTLPTRLFLKSKCDQPPFSGADDARNSRRGAGQNGGPTSGLDLLIQVGDPTHVLHALLYNTAQKIDHLFEDSLRNIAAVPFDVVAVNILRGRHNGVPNYYKLRKTYTALDIYASPACGVTEDYPGPDPIGCFNLITSNSTLASLLQQYYGKVNKIDAFVGMVSENRYLAALGPTAAAITVDQFSRVREGDRFWYQNLANGLFTPNEVAWIRGTSLKYLAERAYPTAHIQETAFFVPEDPLDFFADCQVGDFKK